MAEYFISARPSLLIVFRLKLALAIYNEVRGKHCSFVEDCKPYFSWNSDLSLLISSPTDHRTSNSTKYALCFYSRHLECFSIYYTWITSLYFNGFFPILETKLKAQCMNTPARLNWFIQRYSHQLVTCCSCTICGYRLDSVSSVNNSNAYLPRTNIDYCPGRTS
jgi:hypothetical protein